ncbi:MAG: hypothetical protein K2W96_03745 [Gemmataceae bacterium]|nr:hypothetical protein [Gemmataceae bacterium]
MKHIIAAIVLAAGLFVATGTASAQHGGRHGFGHGGFGHGGFGHGGFGHGGYYGPSIGIYAGPAYGGGYYAPRFYGPPGVGLYVGPSYGGYYGHGHFRHHHGH